MLNFFKSQNITAYLKKPDQEKNSQGTSYIRIEGKTGVKSVMDLCVYPILNSYLLCLKGQDPINHTLKSSQFKILKKVFQYFDSGLNKYVLEARIHVINFIYSFENKREQSKEFWIQKATEIFNRMVASNYISGYTFISYENHSQSWLVAFPTSTGVKPRKKQFKVSNYSSKSAALSAAIAYRHTQLDIVLTKLGFK